MEVMGEGGGGGWGENKKRKSGNIWNSCRVLEFGIYSVKILNNQHLNCFFLFFFRFTVSNLQIFNTFIF